MTKLHLGEIEQPYAADARETTGDVGTWLENKYHIMEAFWRVHGQECASDLAGSMAGSLENVMMGAPPVSNPIAGGESAIEHRFRKFLTSREVEGQGIAGVPTKAALEGVSHRFKKKRAGGRRPSFIDTGLYEANFKAWTDSE